MTIAEKPEHESLSAPRIIAADRLNDGLVIEFDNGRCALYPAVFLYSKIEECEQFEEDVDW